MIQSEIRNPRPDIFIVALVGAGGKMGHRIIDHLASHSGYQLRSVETGVRGLASLSARGVSVMPVDQALEGADIVILALPDRVLGEAAREIVPKVKSGCLVVTLDPAAAHAGELPERADVAYFVTHPCHPSVFDHFETEAERNDFFGGTHAKQAIVCALMQGTEDDYERGEQLGCDIYAPVTRPHRLTVEQMAMLEPAMAETVGICLIRALREALEEVVARGVPRAAAEDFLYGHIKVPLGIAFERVDFPFSDGAKLIAEYGRQRILHPDWKKVFDRDNVREQCQAITSGMLPE
ncbi:MAG: phosphogluconate dehydrogenase C-terminal domain-containing protein [Verrucomicrobiales bacterium]